MDTTQAARHIADLGQHMGLGDLELNADGFGVLVVDEGRRIVAIGYHPAEAGLRLMICVDDLLPTPEQALQLMRLHFSWTDSAGITFALEPDSGALVLQRQVSDAQLQSGTRLADIISGLIDSADIVAASLGSGTQAAPEQEPAAEAASFSHLGNHV